MKNPERARPIRGIATFPELGMTRDQVLAEVGFPEYRDPDPRHPREIWEFSDSGLEVILEGKAGGRVVAVTERKNLSPVLGELICLPEALLAVRASELGLGPAFVQHEFCEGRAKDIAFGEGEVTAWVLDGFVTTVTRSVKRDEWGAPIWPSPTDRSFCAPS